MHDFKICSHRARGPLLEDYSPLRLGPSSSLTSCMAAGIVVKSSYCKFRKAVGLPRTAERSTPVQDMLATPKPQLLALSRI